MKKLVNVPKAELDEKLKQHNEQKPGRVQVENPHAARLIEPHYAASLRLPRALIREGQRPHAWTFSDGDLPVSSA